MSFNAGKAIGATLSNLGVGFGPGLGGAVFSDSPGTRAASAQYRQLQHESAPGEGYGQFENLFPLAGRYNEMAEMPQRIRGNFAPSGAILKTPHLDSPYMDEQIRRNFVPMPAPRPRGPQLFPLAQGLPNNEQGPAQGPNTPVRFYPGMGYGPAGPAGGGLPPTPTPLASLFRGPQMGQA
jgi:hypothetical protein